MRIAFVNTLYPPYGSAGAETTMRLLVALLQRRGHDCTVLTLKPEPGEYSGEVDGVPVHYFPLANLYWPHGGRRRRALRPAYQALDAYNPVMRRRLGRALSRIRPEVVHCHNLQGFSVSAWLAAHALGIPSVQTLHDYYVACPRSAMWRPATGNCVRPCPECRLFAAPRRWLSHLPYAVSAVSRRVLDRVCAAGVFGDTPRLRVIRGINRGWSGGGAATLSPHHGPLRLGFLGRLDAAKGLENLLDAVAAFPPAAVTLQVAGSGDDAYERALRDRAEGDTKVRFLGQVAPESFFRGIDLLVIPSVWEDPFPRVFHEALAHGVPSLVSPLGGLPEVVEHGRTGFIARAASAEALREALADLLRPGAWDRRRTRAALLEAAGSYAPEVIAGQYETLLDAAARRAPLPQGAGEPWQRRSAR